MATSLPDAGDLPNILVILVDDLGLDQLHLYADDGAAHESYYAEDYPYAFTPNIDDLAADGVLYTQARACPLCSPSRAALNGGMYPFESGVGYLVGGANQASPNESRPSTFLDFQPADVGTTSLSDLLNGRTGYSYDTGLIGKSHLGLDKELLPNPNYCGSSDSLWVGTYSWDYPRDVLHYRDFHGVLRGVSQHPNPESSSSGCDHRQEINDRMRDFFWYDAEYGSVATETRSNDGTYYTKYEGTELKGWINGAQEPYLAVWCTIDPHTPYDWPPDNDTFAGHNCGSSEPSCADPNINLNNTHFRAKLEYLDSALGSVLSGIDTSNLTIIFMGDNGTNGNVMGFDSCERAYPSCHPDYLDNAYGYYGPSQPTVAPYDSSRMKGTVHEGGIRVPLIVSGELVDSAKRGTVCSQLVDIVDVYETLHQMLYTDTYLGLATDAYPGPASGSHRYSFAWTFAPSVFPTPTSSTDIREYSHGAVFYPNTKKTPFASDKWTSETIRREYSDYYIEHVSQPVDQWNKIIRTVDYSVPGTVTVSYQLYRLIFGGSASPESCLLPIPLNGTLFGNLKTKLEGLTGFLETDFQ